MRRRCGSGAGRWMRRRLRRRQQDRGQRSLHVSRLEFRPGCAEPDFIGSVSFRGKLRSEQAPDFHKLYQAAEIKSRSAATRWTWRTRRQASETLWLMELVGRRKLRISSKARQKRSAEPNALKPRIDR